MAAGTHYESGTQGEVSSQTSSKCMDWSTDEHGLNTYRVSDTWVRYLRQKKRGEWFLSDLQELPSLKDITRQQGKCHDSDSRKG